MDSKTYQKNLIQKIQKRHIKWAKRYKKRAQFETLLEKVIALFSLEEISLLNIEKENYFLNFKTQLMIEAEKKYFSNYQHEVLLELVTEEINRHRFLFATDLSHQKIRKIFINKIVSLITFDSQVRFLASVTIKGDTEHGWVSRIAESIYSFFKKPLENKIVNVCERIVKTIEGIYPKVGNDVFKERFLEKSFYSLWSISKKDNYVQFTKKLLEESKWWFEKIEKSRPEIKHKYLEHILIKINSWFGIEKNQYCTSKTEVFISLVLFLVFLSTLTLTIVLL